MIGLMVICMACGNSLIEDENHEQNVEQPDLKNMVFIPAGEFIMGSPEGEGLSNERPQHQVYLEAYYIDKYEVTNAQFKEFVDATGYVTDAERSGWMNKKDRMNEQLRHFIPKGGFIANTFTLMTGTVLAQVITILATPIVTRLYIPKDFGVFALFTSATSIVSVVACWSYEQAIVLPEKCEQAINIFALSILIVFGMTFLTLLVMLFGRKSIAGLLGAPQLSFWLWFVPLGVLCGGLYLIFNYWSTRKKKFSLLAISRTSQSVTQGVVQIAVALVIGASEGGLILGYFVGVVVATAILSIQVWEEDFIKLVKNINRFDTKAMAIEYRKFPYYLSWTGLLDTFSQQIPIWLLAHFFTPIVVGFYSLANRILRLPITFITQSVRQVYLQKVSELYAYGKSVKASFIKSTLGLFAVGIVPFSIFFLFGKPLFTFVFGTDWSTAGVYVQIISPWLFLTFINAPARTLYTVCQKQDVLLISHILLTIFSGLSILVGYHLFNSVEKSLLLFSLIGVIFNLCMIGYGYHLTTFIHNRE